MASLRPLPESFAVDRAVLQRIAAHVLGRRRFEVTGRFGLRATPGGFGSPAFGDGPEVVRVAGGTVVRETPGQTAVRPIHGSTLRDLAVLAGADVDADFSCGEATPGMGDPDEVLALSTASALALADWYALGWAVLDHVVDDVGPDGAPSVIQLWPEHFDAGVDVAAGADRRVNLGASPGDGFEPGPYLYVGPWDSARPGDTAYWNAPFGAVLRYRDLLRADDPVALGSAFLLEGVRRMVDP